MTEQVQGNNLLTRNGIAVLHQNVNTLSGEITMKLKMLMFINNNNYKTQTRTLT